MTQKPVNPQGIQKWCDNQGLIQPAAQFLVNALVRIFNLQATAGVGQTPVTATIPLAKLTGGGMNGSLTITIQNGLITAFTLVDPT